MSLHSFLTNLIKALAPKHIRAQAKPLENERTAPSTILLALLSQQKYQLIFYPNIKRDHQKETQLPLSCSYLNRFPEQTKTTQILHLLCQKNAQQQQTAVTNNCAQILPGKKRSTLASPFELRWSCVVRGLSLLVFLSCSFFLVSSVLLVLLFFLSFSFFFFLSFYLSLSFSLLLIVPQAKGGF